VDSKEFRNLLLLLKEDLQEKDIPHRTTMTKRVLELNQEHIDYLSNQMLVSIYFTKYIILIFFSFKQTSMGKISFTMDIWTDLNMKSYMAVTAHWLQKETLQSKLTLCSDLIGFVHTPGSHTGEHLAKVFVYILDRFKLGKSKKVCFI